MGFRKQNLLPKELAESSICSCLATMVENDLVIVELTVDQCSELIPSLSKIGTMEGEILPHLFAFKVRGRAAFKKNSGWIIEALRGGGAFLGTQILMFFDSDLLSLVRC